MLTADEDWNRFVCAAKPLVPWLTESTPRDLAINGSDRTTRALVLGALEAALGPIPDELLASIETLGDAAAWYGKLASSSPSSASCSNAEYTLRTRRVHLRQIEDRDLSVLYAALTNPRTSFRWRYRGSTPSFQDFTSDLFAGTLCHLAVADNTTNLVLGSVAAYRAALDQGTCYFGFVRAAAPREPIGDMYAGLALFFCHLFRSWPLRKIYAEIPGVNWGSFAVGEGTLFDVEGCLREYEFYDGEYHDMRIISISRALVDSIRSDWLPTL